MAGIRKFREMYIRGTITDQSEFPALANREDGHVYVINKDADIADIYNGTATTANEMNGGAQPTNGVYTSDSEDLTIIKVKGDYDWEDMDGAAASLTVGSQLIIAGETRYVTDITDIATGTIIINRPLSSEIVVGSAVTAHYILAAGSFYVPPTHQNPRSATYGKIDGTSTYFTTQLSVGDTVYAEGETRTVLSITDNTHLILDVPFSTTFSGKDIYKWTDPFNKTKLDGTIDTASGHDTYANADYKKVVGNFSANSVGDSFVILNGEGTPREFILTEIVSTTHGFIDTPIFGDLSGIDTIGEATAICEVKAASVFSNTGSHYNVGRIIMWTVLDSDTSGWRDLALGSA